MVQTTFARRTDESENYATYDAVDESFKGFYLLNRLADQVGEYLEATFGGDDGVTLTYDGSTSATHKYSTETDVVRVIYVDPDVVQVPADEEPPAEITLAISSADEEDIEEQEEELAEAVEEEADALIA